MRNLLVGAFFFVWCELIGLVALDAFLEANVAKTRLKTSIERVTMKHIQ